MGTASLDRQAKLPPPVAAALAQLRAGAVRAAHRCRARGRCFDRLDLDDEPHERGEVQDYLRREVLRAIRTQVMMRVFPEGGGARMRVLLPV